MRQCKPEDGILLLYGAEGLCQPTRILPQVLSMRRGSQQGARASHVTTLQNSCLPTRLTGGLGLEAFRSFCMYMYRTSRNNHKTLGNKVSGQFATLTHLDLVGGREASPSGAASGGTQRVSTAPHAILEGWSDCPPEAMTAVVRGCCSVRLRWKLVAASPCSESE